MATSLHACVPESELAQFVNGALAAEHLRQIAEHVDYCPSCQDTVVALADHSDTFVEAVREAGARATEPQEGAFQLGLKRMLASFRVSISNSKRSLDPSSSPLDTADKKQLGPYAVLEQLGSGGMGNVYRATHTKLKRTVALKVLPDNRWSKTTAVSRFEREMEAIGQLDHPHIVRASDAGEDQGMHYLVMEYVDGLDLSRLVNRLGPLPVAEACELARQTAIGLHYAHENGLVHRDIKPANLMLAGGRSNGPTVDEKPTLKILDLGLALLGDEHLREGHELTTVGTLMGTLDYMSPEQGVDSHAVDQRTDVYGLGATLFKLLTGRAPYADPQYNTLMRKMTALATKPAPSIASVRDDLPEELAAVVDRMLSRDPVHRFEFANDVAEALTPHAKDADLAKLLRRGLSTKDPAENITPRVPVTALACEARTVLATKNKPTGYQNKRNIIWPLFLAAGVLAAFGGIIFHFATDYGDVVIRSNDPNATVVVKRRGKSIDELRIENGEKMLRLRTGNYDIEVTGDAEVSVRPSQVEVARGARAVVNVERVREREQHKGEQPDELTPAILDEMERAILTRMAIDDDDDLGAQWKKLANELSLSFSRYTTNLKNAECLGEKSGELEAKKAGLQSKYGPNHPQIRLLEQQIQALQKNQAKVISDLNAAQKRKLELIEAYRRSASQLNQAVRDDVIRRDSRLLIRVIGTVPEMPIDGVFRLEPSGNVHLGPGYGRVKIEGMTFSDAEKAIKSQLENVLHAVDVMVTVPHSEMTLQDPTRGDLLQGNSPGSEAEELARPRARSPETEKKLLENELGQALSAMNLAESEFNNAMEASNKSPGTFTQTELTRLKAKLEAARLGVRRIEILIEASADEPTGKAPR